MTKFFYLLTTTLVSVFLLFACNSADDGNQIEDLEQKLTEMSKASPDPNKTRELMGELAMAYEAAVEKVEDKSQQGEFLYKAAENYEVTSQFDKAVSLYQRIANDYAGHKRESDALFKQGFIYNNKLGDTLSARKAYETFITKFPQDELVKDAQWEIDHFGKSEDEILDELLRNQQGEAGETESKL
ncbi:MAG: tetratricopeptide repeat protein [Bacteroidota bacterium]